MSIAAAAIAGGAALAGTAWSALSGKAAQQRQIAWEKERAQHAHQWEVADLKAAGLNPILSAGGQGATTGGVSAPVPDTSQLTSGISSAIGLYQDNKRIQNETEMTGAEVNLKAQQAYKTAAETITESYKQGLLTEQQANTAMDTLHKEKAIEQMTNQIQLSKKQYDLAEKEYQLKKKQLQVERYKAVKAGRKADAEAIDQELKNADYNFYKYRDTIFGIWDRVNDSIETLRNNNPKNQKKEEKPKEQKTKKETWIKKNGQWVNTALIIGTKLL